MWIRTFLSAVVRPCGAGGRSWCGRRDSNPHIFRYQDLNLARLPVPPRPPGRRQGGVYSSDAMRASGHWPDDCAHGSALGDRHAIPCQRCVIPMKFKLLLAGLAALAAVRFAALAQTQPAERRVQRRRFPRPCHLPRRRPARGARGGQRAATRSPRAMSPTQFAALGLRPAAPAAAGTSRSTSSATRSAARRR